MKQISFASFVLSIIFLHPSVLAKDWFFIGGNRPPTDVDTPLQGIYTEINTDSVRVVNIDGNKGIFYQMRVGTIFKDGRSGVASFDDDEMIRDCVHNKTWHIKTQRWSNNWKELGDYLCDLSMRKGNKWGSENFRMQTNR